MKVREPGSQRHSITKTLYRRVVAILAADGFFYGVIALAILQAVWYVFSIRPGIYDEERHIQNIIIYSHHWSPFLGKQNPAWDYLGEIVRDGSFMFYYVMSWPLRLMRLFTHDQTIQIEGLRLVCTAFFVAGLILYRKAFLEFTKIPKSVIHLLFLFFILIPAVALLPGIVNYDNLVFLLFAAVLLLAVRSVKASKLNIASLTSLLIIGLLISVVKWTSIALFVPAALYVSYDLYRKHKRQTLPDLLNAAKKLPRYQAVLLGVGLVITLGLFIERPVTNVIKYGKPEPACPAVLSVQRCMKFQDFAAYALLQSQKPPKFRPYDPINYYLEYWEPGMTDTADNLLEGGVPTELPIITSLFNLLALAGIVVVLICLRELLKDKLHQLLFVILVAYTVILMLDQYQGYLKYDAAVEIRARYLVQVLPIFLYFVAVSLVYLFGKFKRTLLSGAVVILLLCTQGGSITTYALTTPPVLFWQQKATLQFNNDLQNALVPWVFHAQHKRGQANML